MVARGQATISGAKRGPFGAEGKQLYQHLEDYLRWQRIQGSTPETVSHKRRELGRFLKWLESTGHSMMPEDLGAMDVLGRLDYLMQQGRRPATRDTQLRNIRAWVHWMMDWEIIAHDPCQRIKAVKIPRESKPFIKREQFQALLDICPQNTLLGARRAAMIWLLITSGVRHGELHRMQIADVDWDGEGIKVMGKGQKERHVPFGRDAQRALLRYLHQRRDSYPCLWVTEEGRPLTYRGIGKDMAELPKRAGFTLKDPMHIYRRSFAGAAVKQGIADAYIRRAAGWSDNQMLTKYTRWMEEEAEANTAFRDFRPF